MSPLYKVHFALKTECFKNNVNKIIRLLQKFEVLNIEVFRLITVDS